MGMQHSDQNQILKWLGYTMKFYIKKIMKRFNVSKSDAAVNPNSTEFEVNNWILSEFVVRRLVPAVGMHPYPLNELMLMAGAVCRFKPSHVFEWGTNIGLSARVFYETAKHFNIPMEIHSIDLPDDVEHNEHPGETRGQLVKGKSGVTLHLGDGLNTALEIYQTLPKNSSVLFFVDGDHSQKSVSRELEAIITQVEQPRVLLHDTFFQSADAKYNLGPHLAINDVLERFDKDKKLKKLQVNTGLPGMTLIY